MLFIIDCVGCSFEANELTVRLGEYDFATSNNARRDFAVERIFMHEKYNRRTYDNDIALLKLKKKASFNDDVWPICLPPPNIELEGRSAYVTGINFKQFYFKSIKILLHHITTMITETIDKLF